MPFGCSGIIITTGRAGGLHRPPWGLLPAEPIGSQLNFSCMERSAAIQIAVGCSYMSFLIFLPFSLHRFLLFSRFARIFFLGIAKAFWNHRHCRWFSFTKSAVSPPGGDCVDQLDLGPGHCGPARRSQEKDYYRQRTDEQI